MPLWDFVLSWLRNITTERSVFKIGTGQRFNLHKKKFQNINSLAIPHLANNTKIKVDECGCIN